jgi:hypothetical protein
MLKPSVFMHAPNVGRDNGLLDKLRLYKRKWNSNTGDYEGPEHTTASHFSDSVQYMSDAIKQYFHPTTGVFLINTEPVESRAAYLGGDEINWDF